MTDTGVYFAEIEDQEAKVNFSVTLNSGVEKKYSDVPWSVAVAFLENYARVLGGGRKYKYRLQHKMGFSIIDLREIATVDALTRKVKALYEEVEARLPDHANGYTRNTGSK